MKHTFSLIVFLALFAGFAAGIAGFQNLGSEAVRTYGGSQDDIGSAIRPLADGGFIIAGETASRGAGGTDLYLVRTDALLNIVWERTFGGSGHDIGNDLRVCPDGSLIVVGHTSSSGSGKADLWLVRTDAEGRELWSKTFGSAADDWGFAVLPAADGGFIAAGSSGDIGGGQDIFLVRTDAAGNLIWKKTYGGEKDENGDGLAEVEGGYIVSGTTESFGALEADAFLMAVDLDGNQSWIKTYGGEGVQFGHKVAVAADGGLVLAGASISPTGGEWDVLAVRTDAAGNPLKRATFGFPGRGEEFAVTAIAADDGGFYFCGTTPGQSGGPDFLAVKTNDRLDVEWRRRYGGPGPDVGLAAARTGSGLILAGFSSSFGAGGKDVCLVPLSPNGLPRNPVERRISVAGDGA